MRFRRVVVLAAVLASGAAMAQGTPQPAAASSSEAAAAAPATVAAAKPIAPLSGDPAAGKKDVAAHGCAACHGADGNAVAPNFPNLASQQQRYIAEQLANFKSGARKNAIMNGMAASLTPQEMHDIAAYFSSQTIKPGVANAKLAKAGGELFHQGDAATGIPACAACHGPAGRGNIGVPYPRLAGQHTQYVEQVLTAWKNGDVWGDNNYSMIMPTIAKKLSKEQIAEVASYVQGLHPATAAATASH